MQYALGLWNSDAALGFIPFSVQVEKRRISKPDRRAVSCQVISRARRLFKYAGAAAAWLVSGSVRGAGLWSSADCSLLW